MNIHPLAAVEALRVAGTAIRDILALPRMLRGDRATHGRQTDSVELSREARLCAHALRAGAPDGAGHAVAVGAPARGSEAFAAAAQAKLAEFMGELGKLFSEHGIDTSTEVVLGLDPSGRIVVVNDHPDKDLIEALLEQSGLAEQFKCVTVWMNRARALQSPATEARYGAMGIPHFRLAVQGDAWRTFFALD